MHGPALSGWLLMGLCAVTGAYCLLRARSGTREERGTARAEAVMGLGMAAMAVPAAVLTLPEWSWAVYAALFGGAALHALRSARRGGHHLHHAIGSLAMVYMALVMAPGAGQGSSGGHTGHVGAASAGAAQAAGGIPLLTGLLLAYYALYVLRSAGRLIPASAPAGVSVGVPVGVPAVAGGGWAAGGGLDARPELALACRLTMGLAMFAMLLTL